jgi:flagellar biosynthesis protein FliP
MTSKKSILLMCCLSMGLLFLTGCAANPAMQAPGVTLTVGSTNEPQQVSSAVQLFVLLTVLSLAPSILILATSFTRIVIVLSMVRNAIGTASIPPNQVVIGLSLILTFFVMSPVYGKINETAIQPYMNNQITQEEAFTRAVEPVREFMFKQTREKDIDLFMSMSGSERPNTLADIKTVDLFPAFVISELRTAFTMGFIIYIPFLVIDLIVASILLSMGMMMLPPSLVSLPFKILLFVLVDGWYLIVKSLMMSFG